MLRLARFDQRDGTGQRGAVPLADTVDQFVERGKRGGVDQNGGLRVVGMMLAAEPLPDEAGTLFQQETPMNWDRIEGNWKQVKGQVRQQWGKLTDDDLDRLHGKREELEGVLQERYGLAKDEANRQVDEWSRRFKM
ncbi:hypothetical protein GCM10017643_43470 [Ancylobacter dichloromethanicus]|uniref:CsbD-like domain-containing protein n=2 Tax=Ancylobacter dichloromethanicus TaxID=518825 RepID=A0A9W6N0W3_9HYPH|nr:hypothetical protein GCM10017643_43470 [Ancylobacter dichloromethanicus]